VRPGLHGAGRFGQPQRGGGGQQAAPRALEQHCSQLRFQLGNVAAYGGLAGVENTRRAQQAALVQRSQEGLHQAPVKGGFHGDSVPAAAGFEVFKSALQV